MADDFNSWGGAGSSVAAGAGSWGDGLVRRAARGLGRWMGDGMPASQQMRDWYQQYAAEHPNSKAAPYWAAEHGQNRNALVDARNAAAAISRQNQENRPYPGMTFEPWLTDPNYKSPFEERLNRVSMWFNDGPNLPGYGAIYRSPGNMRAMSTGQKGLRDVPAEGQQPQVGIGQNPYSPEHVQQMRNSGTFMPHPAQWVTDDLGNSYLRPESTWNSVGSFAPGGGSTSVDWRAQALMQAQAEIASGNPSQWAWNIVQMQQNDPSWVTTGIREAQGYLDAANNGLLRQDTATAINQIYQPLTQQFGAVQEFANNWQPPQQVAPQPQKQVHDVAPQHAAPQPAAAPTGFSGINPNLLAAIRRGRGA